MKRMKKYLTLLLALVGTFFGCLIGFAVGALQTIPVDKQRDPVWKRVLLKILHIFLRCYVELFRGTPMIVQAVFIYYGLLQVFGIKMGMWQAGFFIVSINTGAVRTNRTAPDKILRRARIELVLVCCATKHRSFAIGLGDGSSLHAGRFLDLQEQ